VLVFYTSSIVTRRRTIAAARCKLERVTSFFEISANLPRPMLTGRLRGQRAPEGVGLAAGGFTFSLEENVAWL
jgi:hypothetical protein